MASIHPPIFLNVDSAISGVSSSGLSSFLSEEGNTITAGENTVIDIHDLRKVYRVGEEKVVALDHISLQIPLGEICCILGTSGSGKSTLLNLMAGLEKPTRGSIMIAGKRVDKMNEKQLAIFRQKKLGFVFQSYNLLAALTALENVSLPLTFRGISHRTRDKRAIEILSAVGLKTHARHKPTQMSGGQQQRVGIARAFVAKPAIVFADEPTGNLDTRTTKEIMELIVRLAHENNQTLVIVTHDPNVAEYADRIVQIIDGNVANIIEQKKMQTEEIEA